MAPALAFARAQVLAETEPLAAQVRRLQQEAKELAITHVQCLELALVTVGRLASEVSDGGEAYPPGMRDLALRISADSRTRALTLRALLDRACS